MSETIDITGFEGNPRKPLMPEAIKYGVMASLVLIAISLVFYSLGMDDQSAINQIVGWISYIAIAFLILNHYKKKVNNGFLSFGQGVGLSVLTGLVIGVIMAIFMYVYTKFINPDMIIKIQDKAIEDMQSQGLSDEQIEMSMGMAEMFMSPGFFAISTLIAMPIIFTIIGLIASAIVKKD